MAESNKPPNPVIVEKTDVDNREIEAIAAHVRALLMRIVGTDTSRRTGRHDSSGSATF